MLKIDYTVFIQIANFLVLLFILSIILYKPIRKILGQRKAEIGSFQNLIEELQAKFDKDTKELEENMVGARKEGYKEKENLKDAGVEVEKKTLQEALSSAEETIGSAREEIGRDAVNARQSLEDEIKLFSQELAEKILGRSI